MKIGNQSYQSNIRNAQNTNGVNCGCRTALSALVRCFLDSSSPPHFSPLLQALTLQALRCFELMCRLESMSYQGRGVRNAQNTKQLTPDNVGYLVPWQSQTLSLWSTKRVKCHFMFPSQRVRKYSIWHRPKMNSTLRRYSIWHRPKMNSTSVFCRLLLFSQFPRKINRLQSRL